MRACANAAGLRPRKVVASMRPTNVSYRPEIDGLRALAVIPVVLFHAGLAAAGGGYVGVDVFFVISGYLITGIIVREHERSRFSLMSFYERRVRRILPALVVVVVATLPVAGALMVPFQLKDMSQSIVATLLFASNFFFWSKSGYFEADAEQMPLLHTWSLAIEEQFYVVFPLVLALLVRWRTRTQVRVLLVLCLFSLGAAEIGWREAPQANFFLPFGRAWELMAGALCAIALRARPPKPSRVAGAVGVGIILLAVVGLRPGTPYPSLWTLVPCVGTVLIILFCNHETGAGRVLAFAPLRGMGLLSYSAYLWHVPLLAFLRIKYFGHPPTWSLSAAVIATFGFAYLSWRFVEQPFRIRDRVPNRQLVSAALASVAALMAIGLAGHVTDGFYELKRSLVNSEHTAYLIDREAVLRERKAFWRTVLKDAARPWTDGEARRVLIVGDSLAQDLFVAVSMEGEPWSHTQFRRVGLDDSCMREAATTLNDWRTAEAQGASRRCAKKILALGKSGLLDHADEVVLAANWQRSTSDNGFALAELLRSRGLQVAVQGRATFHDVASLSFRLPDDTTSLPQFMYQNLYAKFVDVSESMHRQAAEQEGVRFLDKLGLFCDRAARTCDVFSSDTGFYIYDNEHMTLPGAAVYRRRLQAAGWFE